MVRVKICGITSVEDALMAVAAGADALGFIFHDRSPRHVSQEQAAALVRAVPPFVQTVGLFVNAEASRVAAVADFCRLDLIQLHGDESPEYCSRLQRRIIKAFRVKDSSSLQGIQDYRVAGYLLDAYNPGSFGGTGMTFNWEYTRLPASCGPLILAGGLTPANVAEAVATVAPHAVDVSSGVEVSPGKKDPEKVREFIRRAKGW